MSAQCLKLLSSSNDVLREDTSQPAGAMTAAFLEHVQNKSFPCVGAKAALARNAIEPHEYAALTSRSNTAPLLDDLTAFGKRLQAADDQSIVRSFVALFDGPGDTDEFRFEAMLWSQLQRLHALDVRRGNIWSEEAESDPDSANFSLSLGGHAFFVIGLHPGASRIARRFSQPALVFNSRLQFMRLRADGRYAKMQTATRERDIALQGLINPNLADFGTASEARQYSGRAVEDDWKCPFHRMSGR